MKWPTSKIKFEKFLRQNLHFEKIIVKSRIENIFK